MVFVICWNSNVGFAYLGLQVRVWKQGKIEGKCAFYSKLEPPGTCKIARDGSTNTHLFLYLNPRAEIGTAWIDSLRSDAPKMDGSADLGLMEVKLDGSEGGGSGAALSSGGSITVRISIRAGGQRVSLPCYASSTFGRAFKLYFICVDQELKPYLRGRI